jgi:hypothetical protein
MSRIEIAREDHGKPDALKKAIDRASRKHEIDKLESRVGILVNALKVCQVGLKNMEPTSITEANVKRVCLESIAFALNAR